MSILSEMSEESLARRNNERPAISFVGVTIDGIGNKEPGIKLSLVVRDGYGREAAKYLAPHINSLVDIIVGYNEKKKGEGDGTYKTTMVTLDLGL